jgi:hypothetical protein
MTDPIEICGPARDRRLLRSYSRLNQTCAAFEEPTTVNEIGQALIAARTDGRKVTLRASGLSLHDQSLNNDTVISLSAFNHIGAVTVETIAGTPRHTVEVECGAKWKDVVLHALQSGFVPYVVPTGEEITCGGSLASDGISRYSPSYGTESRMVQRIEFLEVGQTTARVIERPDKNDHSSDDAKLFRAVIGGFGYLGVVTKMTYLLLDVSNVGSDPNLELEVTSKLHVRESFTELMDKQIALLDDSYKDLDVEHWPDLPTVASAPDEPAVYTVAMQTGGKSRGAVFESVYSRGDTGKPYIIYQPRKWWRKWMTLGLSSHTLRNFVNWLVWRSMKGSDFASTGDRFVNKLTDYMFFMQGEVIAKEWLENLPNRVFPTIEQTFAVHYMTAAAFMDEMATKLDDLGVEPTILEALFMPRDSILMSATHGVAGFAITVGWQDIESQSRQQKVIDALKVVSRMCWDNYQGRIHFTKMVYADDDVVRDMFAGRAQEFLALKQQYDPDKVLRNCFFERIFPDVPKEPGMCPT